MPAGTPTVTKTSAAESDLSIVGRSMAVAEIREAIARVAATPRTTVLISGESGAGKELVAQAIHRGSSRAAQPFVAVNCAALSEGLLEAALFGYEPGAFTGAKSSGHEGLVAAAEGGSLFLDEIGELERGLQAKLLRVLQERRYRRVGAQHDRPLDVRILASTHRDLREMVARGAFREDLFYRLNVMSIRVPALRERLEDLPLLARHFLHAFQSEFERSYSGFSSAALERLAAHSWPGNVRELANTIERAALMVAGGEVGASAIRIDGDDRSFSARPGTPAPVAAHLDPEDRTLAAVERAWVLKILAENAGNRSRAARELGVNRATLHNKLRAWGVRA